MSDSSRPCRRGAERGSASWRGAARVPSERDRHFEARRRARRGTRPHQPPGQRPLPLTRRPRHPARTRQAVRAQPPVRHSLGQPPGARLCDRCGVVIGADGVRPLAYLDEVARRPGRRRRLQQLDRRRLADPSAQARLPAHLRPALTPLQHHHRPGPRAAALSRVPVPSVPAITAPVRTKTRSLPAPGSFRHCGATTFVCAPKSYRADREVRHTAIPTMDGDRAGPTLSAGSVAWALGLPGEGRAWLGPLLIRAGRAVDEVPIGPRPLSA